ncbi:MAG: hypothetical protein NTZ93_01230 [Candidatus Beckwithbacteria bacterium]|nr:hypothetical protein [Candidatus Beckwithbacteria bacterium]
MSRLPEFSNVTREPASFDSNLGKFLKNHLIVDPDRQTVPQTLLKYFSGQVGPVPVIIICHKLEEEILPLAEESTDKRIIINFPAEEPTFITFEPFSKLASYLKISTRKLYQDMCIDPDGSEKPTVVVLLNCKGTAGDPDDYDSVYKI